jgi:hypothetical protein
MLREAVGPPVGLVLELEDGIELGEPDRSTDGFELGS